MKKILVLLFIMIASNAFANDELILLELNKYIANNEDLAGNDKVTMQELKTGKVKADFSPLLSEEVKEDVQKNYRFFTINLNDGPYFFVVKSKKDRPRSIWYYNSGSFKPSSIVKMSDFNADGKPDLTLNDSQDGSFWGIYLQNGDDVFIKFYEVLNRSAEPFREVKLEGSKRSAIAMETSFIKEFDKKIFSKKYDQKIEADSTINASFYANPCRNAYEMPKDQYNGKMAKNIVDMQRAPFIFSKYIILSLDAEGNKNITKSQQEFLKDRLQTLTELSADIEKAKWKIDAEDEKEDREKCQLVIDELISWHKWLTE